MTNPKPKKQNNKGFKEKSFAQKIDLNKATKEELQKVSGIGEALSKRIIAYRVKLGGFTADSQLHHVYGLEYQVVQRTLNEFTVRLQKKLLK